MNKTVSYCLVQNIFHLLVHDCVPVDTYANRNPDKNNLLSNSDKNFCRFSKRHKLESDHIIHLIFFR